MIWLTLLSAETLAITFINRMDQTNINMWKKVQRMEQKLTIEYPRISQLSSPSESTWDAFEPGFEAIGPIWYQIKIQTNSRSCFFILMTTVTYSEEAGSCTHVQWTHTRLLCWQMFPRPFFASKKKGNHVASARIPQYYAATGRALGDPVNPKYTLWSNPDKGNNCHLLLERWSLHAIDGNYPFYITME